MTLIFLALLPLALAATPLDRCADLLSSEGLWGRERAIFVTAESRRYPLTFAVDSEIPNGGFLHWAKELPELDRVAEKVLGPKRVSLEMIQKELGFSGPQVRAFVLRKGVDPQATEFGFRDLRPRFQSWFFANSLRDVGDFVQFWERHFLVKGLPFKAMRDGELVEVSHRRFEFIPSRFSEQLDLLERMFKERHTHYHLGIPRAVGHAAGLAIARAVQAKLTVDLMLRWPDRNAPMKWYEATAFSRMPSAPEKRGVTRFNWEEWDDPHPTANLEIRVYNDRAHAMEMLTLGAALAVKHEDLRHLSLEEVISRTNNQVGDASGALSYLANLFALKGEAELARGMRDLADRIYDELEDRNAVSLELRKETRAFLVQHKISARITPELFLKD